MSKRKEEAIVYSQEMLTDGIYSLWIETSMASQAKAGQFIGVFTGDGTKLLARPISICDVKSDEKLLRMVYRVSGGGTDLYLNLKREIRYQLSEFLVMAMRRQRVATMKKVLTVN